MGEAHAVEELAGAVAVPDLDADVAEGGGGGVALDEPEELGDDGAEEDSLGGEQGEDGAAVVVEIEFEAGRGEDGQGAGAGAVKYGLSVCMFCMVVVFFFATAVLGGCSLPIGSSLTLVQDLADQVEVLVLFVYWCGSHCEFLRLCVSGK